MDERFVIVHRTYDPIQAELLGGLLREGGVMARVVGTRSGAAIGVGQVIMEIHIAVPASQAGQATDFLEAYFSGEGIDGVDPELGGDAGDDGELDPDADADSDSGADSATDAGLRPLLAAGTAFLTFGVGHLYARRPWTAAALAAGQLVAMYFLLGGQSWNDWSVGVVLLGGIVACDLIGAPLAVRARRGGLRRGRGFQSALGVAYVAGAMGLAVAVGPRLAAPASGRDAGRNGRSAPDQRDSVRRPFEKNPPFPPLTSQHPANPFAR